MEKAIYESRGWSSIKTRLRLDSRLETFSSRHKLDCDQLVDMHHSKLTREKPKYKISTKN